MTENEIRDLLFNNHKDDLHTLIIQMREPLALPQDTFPSIAQLLQNRTETKINAMVENLETLRLDGKEVRLVRDSDTTTRIDLLGSIADSGDLVIRAFGLCQSFLHAVSAALGVKPAINPHSPDGRKGR